MKKEVYVNIVNDPKMHEYLKQNSYWYKYLNRDNKYYKDFVSEYKANARLSKAQKASEVVNTLDTVNTIFKMLK